jgi:plastocyanin
MQVEILLRKEAGIVPHTFVLRIPDEGIDIDQNLGADAKPIRFTIHKPGRYAFYCRNRLLFFESHSDKGMQGVIEVVEK